MQESTSTQSDHMQAMQMKGLPISTIVMTGHRTKRRNNFSNERWHNSKIPAAKVPPGV